MDTTKKGDTQTSPDEERGADAQQPTLDANVSYDPESAEDQPWPERILLGVQASTEPREEEEEFTPSGPGVYLVPQSDVTAHSNALSHGATDFGVQRRDRAVLRHLTATKGWRSLATIAADWRDLLCQLESVYPHFAAVFVYLRAMCAIAERGDGVLRMDPLLFNGAAGTGKSTIVERIAAIVTRIFHRVSMSTAQSSACLGGSETYWSNSDTGQVFQLLVDGDYANPAILLDELDKVPEDMTYDPVGPLYQLLEPALAERFSDASMPTLPINASRILWFATSNDKQLIPSAILQRFVVFDIPAPTPEQCVAIVRSVDAWLREHNPALEGLELDDAAVATLAGLAPRQVRKRLFLAYGNAAYDQRNRVTAADIIPDDGGSRSIGFR